MVKLGDVKDKTVKQASNQPASTGKKKSSKEKG